MIGSRSGTGVGVVKTGRGTGGWGIVAGNDEQMEEQEKLRQDGEQQQTKMKDEKPYFIMITYMITHSRFTYTTRVECVRPKLSDTYFSD